MEVELEVKGQTIRALSADHLDELLSGGARVIDLRHAMEIAQGTTDRFKEKEIPYMRIPLDESCISEQDLDHLRWEFERRNGPYAVVSTKGKRAATILLMHAGRCSRWTTEEALKHQDLGKSKVLQAQLKDYLDRHRDTEVPDDLNTRTTI